VGLTFSHNGKALAALHSSPAAPHELFVRDLRSGRWTQLTRSGAGCVPAEHLVEPRLVRYRSFDGAPISGFLYLPRTGARPFPLLVWPHGGPEYQETAEYRGRHQFWANHGYAVFAPNFRGSTGFGKRFQKLIYKDWGGGHYKDLLWGIEHLCRAGLADKSRVGIYGGSFGGYTTLWAITQDPELWKAAVAIVAPSNLLTFIRSTHPSWRKFAVEMLGDPETERELLESRSPLFFADRVRTPLLLFQGGNDPRVRRSEAEQFVSALRARGIPVEYALFEDEGHGWRTMDRVFEEMERSLDFLGRHLKSLRAAAPFEAPVG